MAEQLSLDLGHRPALGREVFMISAANRAALSQVDGWHAWPGGKLVLIGPEASGKTHLAHVWAQESGAVVTSAQDTDMPLEAPHLVIEDIDRIAGDSHAEERVFHLHNAVMNGGGRLLLTGRGQPSTWRLGLPDLTSRIAASGVATLEPPDEALLAAVLLKLFADRQIRVKQRLVPYLLNRMDRSFAAAEMLVSQLDMAALASGRPVGPRLAAEILDR